MIKILKSVLLINLKHFKQKFYCKKYLQFEITNNWIEYFKNIFLNKKSKIKTNSNQFYFYNNGIRVILHKNYWHLNLKYYKQNLNNLKNKISIFKINFNFKWS